MACFLLFVRYSLWQWGSSRQQTWWSVPCCLIRTGWQQCANRSAADQHKQTHRRQEPAPNLVFLYLFLCVHGGVPDADVLRDRAGPSLFVPRPSLSLLLPCRAFQGMDVLLKVCFAKVLTPCSVASWRLSGSSAGRVSKLLSGAYPAYCGEESSGKLLFFSQSAVLEPIQFSCRWESVLCPGAGPSLCACNGHRTLLCAGSSFFDLFTSVHAGIQRACLVCRNWPQSQSWDVCRLQGGQWSPLGKPTRVQWVAVSNQWEKHLL